MEVTSVPRNVVEIRGRRPSPLHGYRPYCFVSDSRQHTQMDFSKTNSDCPVSDPNPRQIRQSYRTGTWFSHQGGVQSRPVPTSRTPHPESTVTRNRLQPVIFVWHIKFKKEGEVLFVNILRFLNFLDGSRWAVSVVPVRETLPL